MMLHPASSEQNIHALSGTWGAPKARRTHCARIRAALFLDGAARCVLPVLQPLPLHGRQERRRPRRLRQLRLRRACINGQMCDVAVFSLSMRWRDEPQRTREDLKVFSSAVASAR